MVNFGRTPGESEGGCCLFDFLVWGGTCFLRPKRKTSCFISAFAKDRTGAIPTVRISEDETFWISAATPLSSFVIIPFDLSVGTGRHRSL